MHSIFSIGTAATEPILLYISLEREREVRKYLPIKLELAFVFIDKTLVTIQQTS